MTACAHHHGLIGLICRRIACSLLAIAILPVAFPATGLGQEAEGGDAQSRISRLETEYKEIETKLEGSESVSKRLEDIGYGGPVRQKDLKMLAAKVKGLQLELKRLDAELSGLELKSLVDTPKKTIIRVSHDTYNGAKLDPKEPVKNGDILAFQADISHIGETNNPVPANFFWKVIDPDRHPIDGLYKDRQVAKEGNDEPANCRDNPVPKPGCFRFQVEGFSNGTYTVVLTHENAAQPGKRAQSVTNFSVYQEVTITDLVVDVSPDGKTSYETLHPDQQPYLYVYYEMGKGVDAVTVEFKIIDKKTGAVIDAETTERSRKKDAVTQRVGFAPGPDKVKEGVSATVSASVFAPGGKTVTSTADFRVSAYVLALNVPRTLVTADGKPFSIGVPKQFERPFNVDIDVESGLMIHQGKDRLGGTITGLADKDQIRSGLTVKVTDAAGRRATGYAPVTIEPLRKPKAVLKSAPQPNITSSAAPRCKLPKTYRVEAGRLSQVMHVRIDQKNGEIYTATLTPLSGKGWWARGQAKFGPNCQVLRHGWYNIYSPRGKVIKKGAYANDVEQWSQRTANWPKMAPDHWSKLIRLK